jgi:hypothetical protein
MAFETQGCDLADKLMLALEAGALNGEGDSRCTDQGIPSDGAFIQVDLPTGTPGSYLMLKVDNTKPNNPLTLLRTQFDMWRLAHPCATGASSSGAGGARTGATTWRSTSGAPGAGGAAQRKRRDRRRGEPKAQAQATEGRGCWARMSKVPAAAAAWSRIRRPHGLLRPGGSRHRLSPVPAHLRRRRRLAAAAPPALPQMDSCFTSLRSDQSPGELFRRNDDNGAPRCFACANQERWRLSIPEESAISFASRAPDRPQPSAGLHRLLHIDAGATAPTYAGIGHVP